MRLLTLALVLAGCTPDDGGGKGKRQTGPTDPPVDTDEPPVDTDEPPPPDLPLVVINELMPGNDSWLMGPDGVTRPDWVEILNVGPVDVDLGTLSLRNDAGDLWQFPEATMLPPGERFMVYAGDILDEADPWTGWSLDKDDDKLTLLLDEWVVDYVRIEDVGRDISMARLPDGEGELQLTAWATPGEVNDDEPSPTLDPADETVFTKTFVHQINFTLGPDAMAQINDPTRPEVYVEMDLNGIYYAEVGLKLKGSASYQTMDGKPAFVVDLNQFIGGERYRGLKKFKLHNGVVLDPTRVRDWISYKLSREAGVMAPRVGWAEVYANGEYYGIYMVIEAYDKGMIEYHFPDDVDAGMIFEPNESTGGGWGWGDIGTGSLSWDYETGPLPPDPDSIVSLQEADRIFAGPANDAAVAELWNYVDEDRFLTYLAWEAVIGHTDGYQAPNNWRIYIDGSTHKLQWLPSGAEWTWDNNYGLFYGNGNANQWCQQNPGCRKGIAEHVLTVADLSDSLNLQQEFIDISMWLDPIIQADPRYESSWGGDVGSTREDTITNLLAFPQALRQEVYTTYPDLIP